MGIFFDHDFNILTDEHFFLAGYATLLEPGDYVEMFASLDTGGDDFDIRDFQIAFTV